MANLSINKTIATINKNNLTIEVLPSKTTKNKKKKKKERNK